MLFTSNMPDDMILSKSSSVLFDSSLIDFKNSMLSSVQFVYENIFLKSKINSQTPRLLLGFQFFFDVSKPLQLKESNSREKMT